MEQTTSTQFARSSLDHAPLERTHARLDRVLARFARRPERFAADALRLCARLDARGIDLEITDPSAWRTSPVPQRVSVEQQFHAEIEGLQLLEREQELQLVLRIEFARLRLEQERARQALACGPAPVLARRAAELHALRLELVERNLYLVLISVRRYRHVHAEPADLIQTASAALFRAVDGFDWRHGVLFKTYAVHWLNQGFRNYLYNFNSTIRLPVYLQKSLKHVQDALQRLGDPQASVEDVARETGLRQGVVKSARAAARMIRSLDAPLDRGDASRTLASELVLPEDDGPAHLRLDEISLESGIETALGRLNPRERRVVELRYGIGCVRAHTYSEVARELGVSLERARQILMRAIVKMRTPRLRKLLEPLVG
jgi:RNA polymerase primary sigma factor